MERSLITAALVLAFLSACTPTKREEYELSYDECKKMREDKNHRFWNQPIAVQGCEIIIFEAEVEDSRADQ